LIPVVSVRGIETVERESSHHRLRSQEALQHPNPTHRAACPPGPGGSSSSLEDASFVSPCFRLRIVCEALCTHVPQHFLIESPPRRAILLLSRRNIRGCELIKFIPPGSTNFLIETLAPRFTSINAGGTSLDAYFFLRHRLNNVLKIAWLHLA
jgi:hypothetical protein